MLHRLWGSLRAAFYGQKCSLHNPLLCLSSTSESAENKFVSVSKISAAIQVDMHTKCSKTPFSKGIHNSDSVVLINSADAIGPMNTCFCDLICSFQNEILKKCPSIYSDFKKKMLVSTPHKIQEIVRPFAHVPSGL